MCNDLISFNFSLCILTMKSILKSIVITILRWEAKLVLAKYKPKIIGVTGNVGKTGTKDAIYEVIRDFVPAGKSDKSYNSADFGVALTVLGCRSAYGSFFGWLDVMIHGLSLILFHRPYPEWLVLEIGLEFPGDIKNIVKWVKFNYAIITLLPDVPVHVEFFPDKEAVIKEKMILAKAVPASGKLFINADDPNITAHLLGLKAEILTYGFNGKADYMAEHAKISYEETGEMKRPAGLTFKFVHHGKNLPIKLIGALGAHQIYSILAALAVGDALGLNMISLIEAAGRITPSAGRLRLIGGIKDSIIIDDTYNASPAAIEAGLRVLKELETSGRKIAVLGDMLQLGSYTPDAHRRIGLKCAEVCDLAVTVGLRTKFIDEALLGQGFPPDNIRHFDESAEAGAWLQNEIKKGDIVYVKGSQAMRMEKAVKEIMAEPDKANELLVRQGKEWQE